jgi:hypothetical protein
MPGGPEGCRFGVDHPVFTARELGAVAVVSEEDSHLRDSAPLSWRLDTWGASDPEVPFHFDHQDRL